MWEFFILALRQAISKELIAELASTMNVKNITGLLKGWLKSPKKLAKGLKGLNTKQLDKLGGLIEKELASRVNAPKERLAKIRDALNERQTKKDRERNKFKIRSENGSAEVKVKVSSSWIQEIRWNRVGNSKMGLPTITILKTGKSYDFFVPMSERQFDAISIGAHAGKKFHRLYWRKIGYGTSKGATKKLKEKFTTRLLRRIT